MTRWPHDPTTLCRSDLESGRMRELYVAARRRATGRSTTSSCPRRSPPRSRGSRRAPAGGSSRTGRCCGIRCSRSPKCGRPGCAGCTAASASGRSPRAARPSGPGSCWGWSRGGSCLGVALRLPAPLALDELHLLWRREMVVGSYHPRWVTLDAGGRTLHALTFVVRRDHPQYAGKLSLRAAGGRVRLRRRRVRHLRRLPRAHARRAGRARHRRSVPRGAGGGDRQSRVTRVAVARVERTRDPMQRAHDTIRVSLRSTPGYAGATADTRVTSPRAARRRR